MNLCSIICSYTKHTNTHMYTSSSKVLPISGRSIFCLYTYIICMHIVCSLTRSNNLNNLNSLNKPYFI